MLKNSSKYKNHRKLRCKDYVNYKLVIYGPLDDYAHVWLSSFEDPSLKCVSKNNPIYGYVYTNLFIDYYNGAIFMYNVI